jgi:hypothetical protein
MKPDPYMAHVLEQDRIFRRRLYKQIAFLFVLFVLLGFEFKTEFAGKALVALIERLIR